MKKRTHGFTLLELMFVLVIAGILLGIGVPAMGDFIRNGRMTGAANDVLVAMHYARSEAIKRRLPVVMCTSDNALDAEPACADSAELTGWIVFVDNNGNGQWDAAWTFSDFDGDGNQDVEESDLNGDGWDPDDPAEDIDDDDSQDVEEPNVAEAIVLQHAPLPGTISARSSADPLRVVYLPTGFAQDTNAAQLVMCDSRGNEPSAGDLSAARGITISAAGRAGITRQQDEIQTLVDEIGGDPIGGCS
jgi:prepilin-type N-terminal cleavage/methylation domain-containing protein